MTDLIRQLVVGAYYLRNATLRLQGADHAGDHNGVMREATAARVALDEATFCLTRVEQAIHQHDFSGELRQSSKEVESGTID